MPQRDRAFLLSIILILFFAFGAHAAGAPDEAAEDLTGAAHYEYYINHLYEPSETFRLQTGFGGLACAPNDFVQAIQATIDYSNPDEDGGRYRAALASLGLIPNTDVESFFESAPNSLSSVDYGNIQSVDGTMHSLRTVTLHLGGYRMIAIFLNNGSGWALTDCLYTDNYGIEDTQHIELLTRDDGSPGAWLLLPSVGHGTGTYLLFEEWYNVFTGAYEIGYIREGWDHIGADENAGYYYTVLTNMLTEQFKLSAEIPFTTWASHVQMPYESEDKEELARHMTTGQYGYDPFTATYSLQNMNTQDDPKAPSPATVFFAEPR